MSSLRSLERTVIRNQCYLKNGNTKGFKKAWEDYHYGRTETTDKNGNVVVTKKMSGAKKKRRHNDNGKLIVKQMKMFKNFLNELKAKADEASDNRKKEKSK